ncbi:hypothetical protein DXG03_005077 [Asterophora parasitica]|uniref:Uncharacterized protein n=1 Tax=Asterophora parasitica TaxID=117018 RepID=A0A9P7KA24_9AGAR|nr:hypothetical protein DXG03_005077 [Asterophora parasitica]
MPPPRTRSRSQQTQNKRKFPLDKRLGAKKKKRRPYDFRHAAAPDITPNSRARGFPVLPTKLLLDITSYLPSLPVPATSGDLCADYSERIFIGLHTLMRIPTTRPPTLTSSTTTPDTPRPEDAQCPACSRNDNLNKGRRVVLVQDLVQLRGRVGPVASTG